MGGVAGACGWLRAGDRLRLLGHLCRYQGASAHNFSCEVVKCLFAHACLCAHVCQPDAQWLLHRGGIDNALTGSACGSTVAVQQGLPRARLGPPTTLLLGLLVPLLTWQRGQQVGGGFNWFCWNEGGREEIPFEWEPNLFAILLPLPAEQRTQSGGDCFQHCPHAVLATFESRVPQKQP